MTVAAVGSAEAEASIMGTAGDGIAGGSPVGGMAGGNTAVGGAKAAGIGVAGTTGAASTTGATSGGATGAPVGFASPVCMSERSSGKQQGRTDRQTERQFGRKTHSEQLGCCATHLRRHNSAPWQHHTARPTRPQELRTHLAVP
eukprot:scaffold41354_cov59-Phaeocystis_antarctica.AAC.6